MPFITKLGSVAARAYGWLATTVSVAVNDAYFYLVSLLLSTTSTNGAQNNTFLDSSANNFTITRNGNATQGTFTPFSNTGWSNYFDGSGDSLTVAGNAAFAFGTGDFTVEFWVYITSGTAAGFWDTRNAVTQVTPLIYYDSSTLRYYVNGAVVISGGSLTANTWTHVALARSSGTTRLFVNGSQVGSSYADTNNYTATNTNYIGNTFNSGQQLAGAISNFRIVKGTALYTGTFTPPTAPLTPVNNTSLLTCQSNRFVDTGPNNFTITRNGDTRITANGPFAPSSTTPTSYSGWFDGNGDYLDTSHASAFALNGQTFTMEGWIWLSGYSSSYTSNFAGAIIASKLASGNDGWELTVRGTASSWTSVRFVCKTGATTNVDITWSYTFSLSTWYHVALVKSGNNYSVYINGTLVSTQSSAGTWTDLTACQVAALPITGFQYYFPGAISNLRLVKGTAVYTGNFTVPTSPLTAISGTSILTCQNTTFIDNSSNSLTLAVYGNSQPIAANPFGATTTQPVSYTASPTPTSYSGWFDGTGDYLSLTATSALTLPTSTTPFTVEVWVYPTASGGVILAEEYLGGANPVNLGVWLGATGQTTAPSTAGLRPSVGFYGGGATWSIVYSSVDISLNAWTHIAAVFTGSATKIYVNGVDQSVNTITTWTTAAASRYFIGKRWDANVPEFITGLISNLRWVIGTAVYTSNFTPPTAPLTAISGTALLTCQNATFIDNSPNAFTITANGNAQTNANNPFGFTGTNVDGGAAYFDGTGDFLTAPSNSAYNITSGSTDSFSVECWVYWNTVAANTSLVDNGGVSGTSFPNWSVFLNASSQITFGWGDSGAPGSTIGTLTSSIVPTTGQWYHIVGCKASSDWAIYVNGIRRNQFTGSNTATKTSTSLLRIADGISSQGAGGNRINGYIAGVRVYKGATASAPYKPSSFPFVMPESPPLPGTDTRLLMNFTNAGIYDSAQQSALETVGNAQVSTTQAKWGTTSMSFDGTGDWLLIPDNPNQRFGTGNFTIELWLYLNATGAARGLVAKGTGTTGWLVSLNASNQVVFTYTTSTITSTGTISANTWTYIAVVRGGTGTNQTKIYINGTNDGTGTVATDFTQTNAMYVGADRTGGSALNGYIDDLRITNFARTISTPTAAFPTQ